MALTVLHVPYSLGSGQLFAGVKALTPSPISSPSSLALSRSLFLSLSSPLTFPLSISPFFPFSPKVLTPLAGRFYRSGRIPKTENGTRSAIIQHAWNKLLPDANAMRRLRHVFESRGIMVRFGVWEQGLGVFPHNDLPHERAGCQTACAVCTTFSSRAESWCAVLHPKTHHIFSRLEIVESRGITGCISYRAGLRSFVGLGPRALNGVRNKLLPDANALRRLRHVLNHGELW